MTNSSTGYSASNNNSPNAANCQSSAHAQFASSPSILPLYTTPGSAPGSPTTLALDMKRLLAKPAPPYAHPHSHSIGSGSESEGFSDSSRQKTLLVDRGAATPKMGRSRSLQSLLDYRKERQKIATTPEKDNNYAKQKKERRPRNVLRRRPSTSTHSQTQKSSPALPAMTTTTATPLHSPLPPLSPRSPLTPSMFPAGSPASPSCTLGSASRQATAPNSNPRSGVYPERSVSSFDRPLPLPPNLDEDLQDTSFGSGQAQALKNEVEGGAGEYVISVTDEKGKKVNPRAKLRELKGHHCPSSSSPSPSRSHPSSPRLYHQPHQLVTISSLNKRSSSRSRSHLQNPSSIVSETTGDPCISLTPAAAVVAAYKRQENLPETLAITRSSIDIDVGASMREYGQSGKGMKIKKRPYTSSGNERSATEFRPHISDMGFKHVPSEEDGEKNRPYYTVFGTSSDHVVSAGGPEDRNHLSWEIVPPFAFTHKGSEGRDGGGLRTLTRKMSGRFKRAGNGTQSEGEEERRRVSFHTERERGRPSFQERSRTRAVLEKSSLSLRLSIDKFVEAKVVTHKEKDTTPTSATRSRGSGASTPSPSGGGSKIWKLMKRLSTGALREKFINHEEAPPVPSLPKEYVVPDSVLSFDAKTEVSNTLPITEGFGKAVRKKASVILGVKVTSNCGSPTKPPVPSSPLASQVSTPVIRPSPPMPRPSTTTCSSSPVSSDVASSRFFAVHKPSSMSAHSSTSSLPIEDNVHPPLPLSPSLFYGDSNVGQHIIPPSELGKMHVQSDDGQRNGHGGNEVSLALTSPKEPAIQSPRRQMKLRLVVPTMTLSPSETCGEHDDYTIIHTPLDPEMASLSLPPRRPGLPLGRLRRNTSASGEVGQDLDGEQEADELTGEDMKEWEWLCGRSSNLDVDEKILDSRSGSPLIPSFSAEDPINTFSLKRTSTTSRPNAEPSPSTSSPSIIRRYPSETGYILSPAESLPLPPRPARSPQRPASNPTQSD